jgi:hypothetical protein
MRRHKEQLQDEPDLAVALATFLLNVLILLALCCGAWALHPFIARPDSGGQFLRDFTVYR